MLVVPLLLLTFLLSDSGGPAVDIYDVPVAVVIPAVYIVPDVVGLPTKLLYHLKQKT
jgi:hypothetical protein